MKNTKKGSVGFWILIAVAVVLVVAGIYFSQRGKVNVVGNKILTSQTTTTSPVLAAGWTVGNFMDYPSDLSITPSGTSGGPTYTFPASYFADSTISNASITTPSSCGDEVPPANIIIRGISFYKSYDGLTYGLSGGCNQWFHFNMTLGTTSDAVSAAANNMRFIFDQMVDSYANKLKLKDTKAFVSIEGQAYIDPGSVMVDSGPNSALTVVMFAKGIENSSTISLSGNGYPEQIITPDIEMWTGSIWRIEFELPKYLDTSTSTYSVQVVTNGVKSNTIYFIPDNTQG